LKQKAVPKHQLRGHSICDPQTLQVQHMGEIHTTSTAPGQV